MYIYCAIPDRNTHYPVIVKGMLYLHTVHLSSLCTEQSCLLQTVTRILSKIAGNVLLLTIRVKDYVLVMFTQRARACVRVKRAHMCALSYF
jgi:hypothetical protein